MIQKYEDWKLNEGDLVEINKEMKGFDELKNTINDIVRYETEKLDELLDKIIKLVSQKEIDFIRWKDSPLMINKEGDSIEMEATIDMRFKNRDREDFEETYASRFDPTDWKGTYIANSYEDAVKEVDQILEEIKIKFKVDCRSISNSYKKEVLLPELRTKVIVSVKSVLASIITNYSQENRGRIGSKKFGL